MTAEKKRHIAVEELEAAHGLVDSRYNLEQHGMIFMGSLTMAAQEGFYSIRECELMGRPVLRDEVPGHCAMMVDCPVDLCVIDEEGNRVLPCLPVYWREAEG